MIGTGVDDVLLLKQLSRKWPRIVVLDADGWAVHNYQVGIWKITREESPCCMALGSSLLQNSKSVQLKNKTLIHIT